MQDNPALQDATVGSQVSIGGSTYLITTGKPTCDFGCLDGFDANCDGRIGDYCRVGLNRTSVSDVGTCLAEHRGSTRMSS